jgi:hypothetical protein
VQGNTVRRQALLTGTAWTLAVGAGLVWFKSVSGLPIDRAWPLGVIALGWALVLWYALAAAHAAAAESARMAERETRAMVDAIARVICVEVQRARSELILGDELLEHAIQELMVAFDSVRDVNGAVIAMQFRDVVGQKLGHVRGELDTVDRLMRRIGESGQENFAARVQELLHELEHKKASNPAQQQLMHAGDVTLF